MCGLRSNEAACRATIQHFVWGFLHCPLQGRATDRPTSGLYMVSSSLLNSSECCPESVKLPTVSYQGTEENRLLVSIFYGVGKELGRLCPFSPDLSDARTKDFFESGVQDACRQISFLADEQHLSEPRIQHAKHKVSLKTFLKLHARNGFRQSANKGIR